MSDQPTLTNEAFERVVLSESAHRRRSRRQFLVAGAAAFAGFRGWRWIQDQPTDGGIPSVLRGGLEFNEGIWTANYSAESRVKEFSVSEADPLPVNGLVGMDDDVSDDWRLSVTVDGVPGDVTLGLDDIRGLGEVDLVVRLKCIEGWSVITHWTGVPFARLGGVVSDVIGGLPRYVSLETVGGGYYVGLDTAAAMHPQVLLGTGLDGQPLTAAHGAPLRLVSPIHYGIKSIKQLGSIRFTEVRPRDYWAERGYDWHSQH